jgi:hypothetical protein
MVRRSQTTKNAPKPADAPASQKPSARAQLHDAKFVSAYLRTGNATEAYQQMRGHKGSRQAARVKGMKRLRKPSVQRRIRKAILKCELSDEEFMARVNALMKTDITDFHDPHGNFLPMSQWPDFARVAVVGHDIVIKNAAAGDGHTDTVLKLRLHNKRDVAELIAKLRGKFTEKVRLETDEKLLALLDAGRRRNAERKG